MVILNPKSQFVIKTKTLRDFEGFQAFSKVFVNVCYDDNMPIRKIPDQIDDFPLNQIFELINSDDWTVPMAISQYRITKDKNGVESIVFDAVLNKLYINWTLMSVEWKNVLTFLICNEIESNIDELIDRDQLKFPKRLSIDDPLQFEFQEVISKQEQEQEQKQEEEQNKEEVFEITKKPIEEFIIRKSPNGKNQNEEDIKLSPSISNGDLFIVAKETKKVKREKDLEEDLILELTTLDKKSTSGSYTNLLKIISKFPTKFDIKYHQNQNQLIINSKLIYPLKMKVNEFSSFFVKKKNTLYIYIK